MIKIFKVEGYDVKEPAFNYDENAGADFYIPNYNETFLNDFKKYNSEMSVDKVNEDYVIRIAPHKNVIVPSGWYTKLEESSMALVCNKSGVANKQHLSFGAHVIDESYQGNLLMSVFNYSNDWVTIKCGEKLVQIVQVPILKGLEIVKTGTKEEFFGRKTERGEGALGSTGLK